MFDMDDAQVRLGAAEHAALLLDAAMALLLKAGVKNAGVLKALGECCKEIAEYRRTTKFAINKRRDRSKQNLRGSLNMCQSYPGNTSG